MRKYIRGFCVEVLLWFETYLVGDLELLALADVRGLGDSSLKSAECSLVEGLKMNNVSSIVSFPFHFHSSNPIVPWPSIASCDVARASQSPCPSFIYIHPPKNVPERW